MSDILLLNQYYSSSTERPQAVYALLPYNLLSVASYLKANGADVKIRELGMINAKEGMGLEKGRVRCGLKDDEILMILEGERPRIVGLGCQYTRHYIDIITLARLVRSFDKNILIVLGGNHASALWSPVLKEPSFDLVVRGEGEITFLEVCREFLSGRRDWSRIPGLAYRDREGGVVTTPDRPLIKDLDTLPIDYSLVDVKWYARVSELTPYIMRSPVLGIVTSRGCPGTCVYCTVKSVWGRTWRGRSPRTTVDEIETLFRNYDIREFSFLDDSASLDRARWRGICEEIIRRKLDIRWSTPNGIAHWTLDEGTLDLMKRAGCYRITFGIESGNAETRNFLGKPFPLEQAERMIRHANKIGLWTICTHILGFPYETRAQMEDTVRFAKRSGTDFATFYLLAPHVTSDVYAVFCKEGLIDFDDVFFNNEVDLDRYEAMNRVLDDGGTANKHLTGDEIKRIQMRAYRSFIIHRAFTYLNPLRLLRKIRSREDLRYLLKIVGIGAQFLERTFTKNSTKALLYDQD